MEFVSPEGLRLDGRRPADLRRFTANIGLFDGADGSAYVEHGNTKVLAVVYGPSETRAGNATVHDQLSIQCEYGMAPFSTEHYRPKNRRTGRKESEIEMMMSKTYKEAIMMELYPKSEVVVCIQVLQSDGGNTMAAINAGTLALIDAGIAMKEYVVACTAVSIDGTAVLDCNQQEANAQGAELMVAVLPKSGQIISTQMSSRIHVDHFEALLNLAQTGCDTLYGLLREKVLERTASLATATK